MISLLGFLVFAAGPPHQFYATNVPRVRPVYPGYAALFHHVIVRDLEDGEVLMVGSFCFRGSVAVDMLWHFRGDFI